MISINITLNYTFYYLVRFYAECRTVFCPQHFSLIKWAKIVRSPSSKILAQHLWNRFAAKCEAAAMRISTSSPRLSCLPKNTGLLTVGGESMPQAREFKYLQGSRVIGRWNMRWAGSLVWHQQVFRQRSYQLIYVPSPTAISFGEWPKVWDHGYKRPKMSLLCSQLDSALEIGWRARTWAAAPLLHTEVSKGVWSWLLPFKSLLGGDPAVDAELTGGYVWSYIYWYWDTSGFRRESWKVCTGRGTFGILCFACSYCDQIPDKWRMDGWMDEGLSCHFGAGHLLMYWVPGWALWGCFY